MKFSCSQSELNNSLGLVSRAVSPRPTHPILGNILLEVVGDRLTLTGFDLSVGVRVEMPAEVEKTGAVTVPAKLFADIVSRLSDDLTVELEGDNLEHFANRVIIRSESGRFELGGLEAEEFPSLPEVAGEGVTLPAQAFLKGLAGSVFAASTDDTKQVLTGVHIHSVEDGLEFAATDGHRLAVMTVNCDSVPDLVVTLPGRALRELERLAGQAEETTFFADDTQAVFVAGDRRLTCRKLEGAYPNYPQLIPAQFSREFTVDRRRLISGLERVAVLADQKTNLVKISLDTSNTLERLCLEVEGRDVGNGRDTMPVQVLQGTAIEIGFNLGYLLHGLKAFTCQEVKISCNEPTQPVILSPLNGDRQIYLVMPVQIVR
jgi:DNA polymerase-3 subunit beta